MTKLKYRFMGKISLILIVLYFFLGLILEQSKTQSPCISGYVYGNTTIIVNGCPVNIDICYKCAPHALVASEFRIMSYAKVDTSCNYMPPIPNDSILQLRIADAFLKQNSGLANFCNIQPCNKDSSNGMIVELYLPLCVQKSNIGGVIRRFACSTKDGHCKKTVRACATANGVYYTTLPPGLELIGNGNCYWPTEPKDPVDGDTSQCYRVKSPCGE